MTELLAPAGDESTAYIALNAGADAVYVGLPRFSARASAENATEDALLRITRYAHLRGAKVYVTLNTLVKEKELSDFFSSAERAWDCGADAILMQDIFLGKALKEAHPDLCLHLSTQAGCCNVHGAEVAKEYGFSRVVLARETPLEDIAMISSLLETEAFVQGALCTCFSGQCYFSSFAGGNSGNRGRCKQPCRKKYSIDRKGFEAYAYALSTSDLCVGDRVKDLLAAGVTSLKIEGRMRRPEYVAAAVDYYRALLGDENAEKQFSALKRAYNRGDYTTGLAFGQNNFLSRDVQGHIGERVGEVSMRGSTYFCKSNYVSSRGDGYKILRNGKEVGGASFSYFSKDGFGLESEKKLKVGDEVRLTTDSAGSRRLLALRAERAVRIDVRIVAGEKPKASCEGYVLEGDDLAEEARSCPLSADEIGECFEKTDGLPLFPVTVVETEGAFLPKSRMNAFRRAFYEGLKTFLVPDRIPLVPHKFSAPVYQKLKIRMRAEIGETPQKQLQIYKPKDYSRLPEGKQNAYLYLPPLFTAADERLVAPRICDFEGIYTEGYYGIALAKKYNTKLFAGTGFNITNSYAAFGAKQCAVHIALSKELSRFEQEEIAPEGSFALSEGDIKLMDLCYCPFGKTCRTCDRRDRYTLTDEEGRRFPLRRYELNGCRFEVYNCAPLHAEGGASELCDRSVGTEGPPTRGHSVRSML